MAAVRKGFLYPTLSMIIAFMAGFLLTCWMGEAVLIAFLGYLSAGIADLALFLEETLFLVGIPALAFIIILAWKWQIAFAFVVGCAVALLLMILGVEPSISV